LLAWLAVPLDLMSGIHCGGSHGCPGSDPGQESSPALISSRLVTVTVTAELR